MARNAKLALVRAMASEIRTHSAWQCGLKLWGPATALTDEHVSDAGDDDVRRAAYFDHFAYSNEPVPNPVGLSNIPDHGCNRRNFGLHDGHVSIREIKNGVANIHALVKRWRLSTPLCVQLALGPDDLGVADASPFYFMSALIGKGTTQLMVRLEKEEEGASDRDARLRLSSRNDDAAKPPLAVVMYSQVAIDQFMNGAAARRGAEPSSIKSFSLTVFKYINVPRATSFKLQAQGILHQGKVNCNRVLAPPQKTVPEKPAGEVKLPFGLSPSVLDLDLDAEDSADLLAGGGGSGDPARRDGVLGDADDAEENDDVDGAAHHLELLSSVGSVDSAEEDEDGDATSAPPPLSPPPAPARAFGIRDFSTVLKKVNVCVCIDCGLMCHVGQRRWVVRTPGKIYDRFCHLGCGLHMVKRGSTDFDEQTKLYLHWLLYGDGAPETGLPEEVLSAGKSILEKIG